MNSKLLKAPPAAQLTSALTLSLLLAASGPVSADAGHQPTTAAGNQNPPALPEKATDQTQALIQLAGQWQQARDTARGQALKQVLDKAAERRDFLAALIQSNPAEVLRVAIPEDRQLGMPAEVMELLEQRLQLEGELEVIHVDGEGDNSSRYLHILTTPFGERFQLHAAGPALELQSGAHIRLNGLLIPGGNAPFATDGDIALDQDAEPVEELVLAAGGSESSAAEPLAALPNTFGEQRTAVFLVNFQDNTSQPWTHDQVRDVVFSQSSNFFMENSFQQTWLAGDVLGWYTLPLSSTTCDYKAISTTAKEQAQSQGVDLSGYSRLIYAFPRSSACGWAGLGSVGGSPSSSWINGYMDLDTVSHELGHNLGLYHSHALECGSQTIGSNCSSQEYGDRVDRMGQGDAQFNAFQKELLGWLDTTSLPVVSGSGNYTLDTYATPLGGAPKALKVLKETDATTGKNTWYYITFRRPASADSGLGKFMNTADGVVIHTGSESSRNSSYLLDMTPASNTWDWDDLALIVGRSYDDAAAGVSITTNWVDATSASVQVTGGLPPVCTETAPKLSATPAQSDWLPAGASFTYSVTLTNLNSSTCAATTYSLNASVPTSWSAAYSQSAVSLAPGESVTLSLQVTSAASAADGFYNLTAGAVDGPNTATTGLTFVVSTPQTNSAPVAVSDSATLTTVAPISIAVLGNDHDPDGDAIRVYTVTQGSKGSVAMNADGTLTYYPGKRFKNGDSFTYSITDGAKTASTTVTITLESSGGTTGGDGTTSGGKGNGKNR